MCSQEMLPLNFLFCSFSSFARSFLKWHDQACLQRDIVVDFKSPRPEVAKLAPGPQATLPHHLAGSGSASHPAWPSGAELGRSR